MFGLLRMTHSPVAELGKSRRTILFEQPLFSALQMDVARSRVPNIEPRRALLRCENGQCVGAAFLRNRDFGAGIFFERPGERFTPWQWNGTEKIELLWRCGGPKRRARTHDSGEHAKRAQRYRHGSLPSFSLIRLRP